MSDNIQGLSPEHAARLAHLVERCEPLLDQDEGMEHVQRLLRDLGAGVLDSITVTRELLGSGPGSLGEAKGIVLSSAARTTERTTEQSAHQQLVDVMERAKDVADGLLLSALAQEATRNLAIDGIGGSGKTTLAAAVAGHLDGAVTVHVDDFYRPMPDREQEQL